MYYSLSPQNGWSNFPDHKALIDHFYGSFLPLVNQANWHYLNPSSDTAIFEGENGSYIYLEFQPSSAGEQLMECIISAQPGMHEQAEKLLTEIQQNFSLQKSEILKS